ncbi:hypothetical protein ACH34R_32415, partial [Spongiactinospora sp. 9N601]
MTTVPAITAEGAVSTGRGDPIPPIATDTRAAPCGSASRDTVPVFVLVGTPGDRRVRMFADALAAFGVAEPVVIAWRDVLAGATLHIPEGAWVRIDSPGEDPATDALLRGPGTPTRVGGGASWYAGFLHGLERVRQAVAHTPGARLLGDIDEIAIMFNKRHCHAHLTAAGIPVPPTLPIPP